MRRGSEINSCLQFDRSHKGESGQLPNTWDCHQPVAETLAIRPKPASIDDRPLRRSAPQSNPAWRQRGQRSPLLPLRALSTKAAVSARGSSGDRHAGGALSCHSVRRQETRAARHDLPPFDPDPLRGAAARDIAEEPRAGRPSGAELSVQVRSGTRIVRELGPAPSLLSWQERRGMARHEPFLVGWDSPDRNGRIVGADPEVDACVALRVDDRSGPA